MTQDGDRVAAVLEYLSAERRETHRRILALVEDLSDDQLRWHPGPHSPAIGFHLWHLARWADYDRSHVEDTPQLWEARGLAERWGIPAVSLGQGETGTGMGDDASDTLVLPARTDLIDYARDAFASLQAALDRLPPGALLMPIDLPTSDNRMLNLIGGFLTHDNRHLGMIEALRGMLGLHGSATN